MPLNLTYFFIDKSVKMTYLERMKKRKPLPIPIPLDLAELLGVHPTQICHINAGRRKPTIEVARKVMELSLDDDRLSGLHFLNLRPDLKKVKHWICQPMIRG
jgi:predicted transcriptional regulator